MVVKISLIMAVFNGEDWIEKSIKNINCQDFEEYEFIIVNDGSIDSTEEKILKYVEFYPKIKYYKKKHTGLTDSLNFALSKAVGKWVARIDVDDASSSNRLTKQIEIAESKQNIVLIGSNFYIKKANSIIYTSKLPNNNNKLFYRLLNMKGFFPHSSAFFLRSKANQIGGYRNAFIKSQDHDLWLRLSEKGEIACAKDYLVQINDHNNRISNSNNGWPQYVYAFLAISSYILRKKRINILENKINNNDIDDVLKNIDKFLVINNFYSVELLKRRIKKLFNEKENLQITKNLMNLISFNKHLFFILLKRILFGTNLPSKFCLDYINNSKKIN